MQIPTIPFFKGNTHTLLPTSFFLVFILWINNQQAKVFNCASIAEIHEAMFLAQPGDEILIQPGIYEHDNVATDGQGDFLSGTTAYYIGSTDGTAENPITIRSANQENRAVLRGDDINKLYVLRILGDYWVVKDLILEHGQKGLMIDNANYVWVENIDIHEVGQEGLHVRDGSDHCTITHCKIYDTGLVDKGFGEGIYIGSDKGQHGKYDPYCLHTTVSYCTLGPGITAEHFDIKEETANTIIEHCVMDGEGISGDGNNFADTFIDLKGDKTIIRCNVMNQNGNNTNLENAIATVFRQEEFVFGNFVIHDNIYNATSEQSAFLLADRRLNSPVHVFDNTRNPEGLFIKGSGDDLLTLSCCPEWYTHEEGCNGNPTPPVSPLPTPTPEKGSISLTHIFLEGLMLKGKQQMSQLLKDRSLIPLQQPFSTSAWDYQGNEGLSTIPDDMVDWILLRLLDQEGNVVEEKACVLTLEGEITTIEGSKAVPFDAFSNSDGSLTDEKYVLTIHHKSHLGVAFEIKANERIDPLEGNVVPLGNEAMKEIENGGILALYSGDFDSNGIINNLDANLWRLNSAALNQYVDIDADANGIVNNQDYNLWRLNRSKLGSSWVQQ